MVRVFSLVGKKELEFLSGEIPEGFGGSVAVQCRKVFVETGPGPGFPARAAAYSPTGTLLGSWDFSSTTSFRNGIQMVPLPLDCTEQAAGGFLLWGTAIAVNSSEFVVWTPSGAEKRETLPTTYGLNLTILRLRGRPFIAVAPGPLEGYPPWIRVFRERRPWELVRDFVAFTDPHSAGANLAAVDVDRDGRDELVVGEGCAPGRPPVVRLLTAEGELLGEWNAYD